MELNKLKPESSKKIYSLSVGIIFALLVSITLFYISVNQFKEDVERFDKQIMADMIEAVDVSLENIFEAMFLVYEDSLTNSLEFKVSISNLYLSDSSINEASQQKLITYFSKFHFNYLFEYSQLVNTDFELVFATKNVNHTSYLKREHPSLVSDVLSGKKVVFPLAKINITNPVTDQGEVITTIQLGIPVRDVSEQITMVLLVPIDPDVLLAKLTGNFTFGDTGETFLFDLHGVLLNPSRFESELFQQGLIDNLEQNSFATKLVVPQLKSPIEHEYISTNSSNNSVGEKHT